MNPEFEKCLKLGKIRRFSRGKTLCSKEINTALADFKHACRSMKDKNYKWATIQTYYSMFHSARALLYAKNYRERSHYCLIAAVRNLYVDKKLLSYTLIEELLKAKNLRENADYYDDWSKTGAESLLNSAEKLLKKAKILIAE